MSEEGLSAAEKQAMETEFCERTGASAERAREFLADNWDLELAVHNFFLVGCASEEGGNSAQPSYEQCLSDVEIIDDDSDTDNHLPSGSTLSVKKKEKTKRATNSKFATLSNLNQDNSSDDEDDQAFYAGGSVHSGQQILGPGKNRNDIIADMFKSIRELGGTTMSNEQESSSSSAFTGTGYKLGATPDDTTVVKDPKSEKNKKESEQVVILRLWQNGFSLDGGDLRPYSDPSNAQFLEYVRRGEIPPELRRGSEVFLTMEDRRHEEFSKIASGPSKPFQGKGYLLGSPVPTIEGSTAAPPPAVEDSELNKKKAESSLNINENEPTTNIQFRLADGSRISGRFNLTHTIAHLREYIVTAVPAYQLQTFILLTTFPNKELTDFNQTIKDAGLMNALVVQRLQ